MLNNLIEAMDAKNITRKQIASALNYSRYATVSDKLNGTTVFSFDEALKLKRTFFPEYDLEFLFEKEKELQEV